MTSALLRPVAAALLLAAAPLAHAATLTLTPGQTGRLGGRILTLIRVQDSRCPINARCVRAGELKVSVLVREGQRSRLLHLELPATAAPWAGVGVSGATGVEIGKRAPLRVTFTDRPS